MITTEALNTMADAPQFIEIHLHSGDPGASGTDNLIADTETAATLGPAVNGVRSLENTPVEIDVPATTVSHLSIWSSEGLMGTKAFLIPETYAAPGVARVVDITWTVSDEDEV